MFQQQTAGCYEGCTCKRIVNDTKEERFFGEISIDQGPNISHTEVYGQTSAPAKLVVVFAKFRRRGVVALFDAKQKQTHEPAAGSFLFLSLASAIDKE